MALLGALLIFLISLIVSGLIIYLVTRLFGEKEGFGTAVLAALAGAVIYAVSYYLIGIGWAASLIGGIVWLIALGTLYKIGWLRSFVIAVIVWIFAAIVGLVLPTIGGPL